MLVDSGVYTMDVEDSGLLGTRVPRATDFSIAAIIGRSSRAAAEVLKLKSRNKLLLGNTMRPLGTKISLSFLA
jgi:hypothetical protein